MSDTKLTQSERVRSIVRQKYSAAAETVLKGKGTSCCGGSTESANSPHKGASCCGGNTEGVNSPNSGDVITKNLYSNVDTAQIPEAALVASLGCGNPTADASLSAGEVVLDLGSGGGIDVLLSAKRVGSTGFVYGLDMTDEMLVLAQKNKAEAGLENVKFLKGQIEEIPLPDNSVDVIISNCVINLSPDKDQVLREAFRVLRPGGRFAVSDLVVEGELPSGVRADMEAYVGCVAGALEKDDYLERLSQVGFVNASIEPTRHYKFADLEGTTIHASAVQALCANEKVAVDGRIMSAFIRAVKPKGDI